MRIALRFLNSVSHPGEQHRKQRKMMNPVFSIANMRNMSAYSLNPGHLFLNVILLLQPPLCTRFPTRYLDAQSSQCVPLNTFSLRKHWPCASSLARRRYISREEISSVLIDCHVDQRPPMVDTSLSRIPWTVRVRLFFRLIGGRILYSPL